MLNDIKRCPEIIQEKCRGQKKNQAVLGAVPRVEEVIRLVVKDEEPLQLMAWMPRLLLPPTLSMMTTTKVLTTIIIISLIIII